MGVMGRRESNRVESLRSLHLDVNITESVFGALFTIILFCCIL